MESTEITTKALLFEALFDAAMLARDAADAFEDDDREIAQNLLGRVNTIAYTVQNLVSVLERVEKLPDVLMREKLVVSEMDFASKSDDIQVNYSFDGKSLREMPFSRRQTQGSSTTATDKDFAPNVVFTQ